jgi:hypothetical protein
MSAEQMARMEREMNGLQREFKAVSASYGDTVLNLVVASGYLSSLVGNARVSGYLERHYPEILSEFRAIVAATSLEESGSAAIGRAGFRGLRQHDQPRHRASARCAIVSEPAIPGRALGSAGAP